MKMDENVDERHLKAICRYEKAVLVDILRAEVKDDTVVGEVLNMQGSLGGAQKEMSYMP